MEPSLASLLFARDGDGWTFAVRVTPGASRNAVTGVERDQNGACVLKVKVTAIPEQGRANAAVIRLLAKSWKVPKGAITVVRGTTGRNKSLEITCGTEIRDEIIAQLENMDD